MTSIYLGTSAFTAAGWNTAFYPPGMKSRGVTIYAYANNHYAGHGPATVEIFQKLFNVASEVLT